MKLELYYKEYCPFCRIVLNEINNKGFEQIKLVDIENDLKSAKKHFELTGRNTVPCLYINDKPMFESSDIIQWINTSL
ncbi:MAG: glutathione S-transferase N-terminal domain-containing protein [Bacteriovoracaceae bacterium]|jgi:glutaredoxin|nr:glutathione S-transferase N-terminal domain-containing protein [Bacteriovoracaceae bacterium]